MSVACSLYNPNIFYLPHSIMGGAAASVRVFGTAAMHSKPYRKTYSLAATHHAVFFTRGGWVKFGMRGPLPNPHVTTCHAAVGIRTRHSGLKTTAYMLGSEAVFFLHLFVALSCAVFLLISQPVSDNPGPGIA